MKVREADCGEVIAAGYGHGTRDIVICARDDWNADLAVSLDELFELRTAINRYLFTIATSPRSEP